MKIKGLIVGLVLAVGLGLTGCTTGSPGGGDSSGYHAEDCDAEDMAKMEDDCGYWAADGTFVYWYWIGPHGGYRPAGWTPDIPPGAHRSRPANAKPLAKPTTQARPKDAPIGRPVPTAPVPKYTPPPRHVPTGGIKPGTGSKPDGGVPKPPAPKPPAPKPPPKIGK